ncbi:hypothetical protein ANCDUO_27135 [Ancylostoma duodenale]|uniref:Uncharacterized protein n=1 Tax=Ancylostoma duodenale TaxID=51022 RepID=A0A0C2F7K3_9BILA|nr:hypothetical protein ANCDUO_27135 [Ancylostoma duodenale]
MFQAWKAHLTTECYNNPRRNGPEMEFDTAPEIKSEERARPSSSASTKLGTSGGRLIDANKLVAALQDVQQRKKQESLKKKAATIAVKETESQQKSE